MVKLKPVTYSNPPTHDLISTLQAIRACSQKWGNSGMLQVSAVMELILQLQHHGASLVLISGRCISYVWGREECAGFHNHEATVHMAHCCNEGVMFLPLIYPDYTMERESLLMEPCVPPLHLSICLFSSSDCRGNCTVSHTGQTCTSPHSSLAW